MSKDEYCLKTKEINSIHTELWHPLEDIIWATGKVMGLQLTGMFKTCENCALG